MRSPSYNTPLKHDIIVLSTIGNDANRWSSEGINERQETIDS